MAASQPGRPSSKVNRDQLNFLLGMRVTWKEISTIFRVSAKTLQRRAKKWNASNITDSEIDTTIRDILQHFPTAGEVMLAGHLKIRNISIQRRRLRDNIHRICGHRSKSNRIRRRVYSVPGPNYLWHADGHHKLIKYRLVIRGAIDGFFHLVTYL